MNEFIPNLARILIVDDQELNISLLERILGRAGYKHIYSTQDSQQILQLLKEVEPDIILSRPTDQDWMDF